VTRGGDGKIRAFINACSHRSATILGAPAGNAKLWTCPFHNWTYDTKGNCISITLPEDYEESGICKEKAGLREVRTGMKFGLVFINIDDDAPSFDDFFGDAFEILEDVMGVEPLEVFHHHKAMLNAN
jgi:methanesulfonate monooxygenase large subunit